MRGHSLRDRWIRLPIVWQDVGSNCSAHGHTLDLFPHPVLGLTAAVCPQRHPSPMGTALGSSLSTRAGSGNWRLWATGQLRAQGGRDGSERAGWTELRDHKAQRRTCLQESLKEKLLFPWAFQCLVSPGLVASLTTGPDLWPMSFCSAAARCAVRLCSPAGGPLMGGCRQPSHGNCEQAGGSF